MVTAPEAEVTITEKTVSVKKEKVTMVGDMETRVVESSPTFSETLLPITEVTEGEMVRYAPRLYFIMALIRSILQYQRKQLDTVYKGKILSKHLVIIINVARSI